MTSAADLVIRGGRIVTPDGIVEGDLSVLNGRIKDVGTVAQKGDREIEALGKWVMPGGVDPHAHIEQMSGMGVMNADTFETATCSAALGGTTTVISFVAQAKGQKLGEALADYTARARRGAMIDHAFHLIISDPHVAEFAADLERAIAAGHRSLKLFTTYDIGLADGQILDLMVQARRHGALVCIHAENDAIIAQSRSALVSAGQTAPRDHARSRPRVAEIEAVSRMCHFAEYTGQTVMLFHISTREAVAQVRAARARGAPVWAETCPHYLFMTEELLDKPGLEGAKWMCSPPQRTEDDQDALWAALLAGTLSLISSDHAPYRFDATGKLSAGPNAGFHQIANGLPGLETRLPLLFDAMVTRGRGGPEAFAELTSHAPARIYGLPQKGAIAEGMDADIVIWDPEKTVTYGADDLHDNVGYNPFEGHQVTGWPEQVILRGRTLVSQGAFLGTPGSGRWIKRPQLATQPRGQTG